MNSTLFWVGYVLCGLLAYVLLKSHARGYYESFPPDSDDWRPRFSRRYELLCRGVVCLGYFGLLVALFVAASSLLAEGVPLRLCLRMPKELCEPRRSS